MTTFYVDVSHHDRDRRGSALNWTQILPATSFIMMAKMTEGDPASSASTDPYGVQALRDARTAGAVMRGGYHVPRHGDQASTFRQVDFFRRQLDLAGGNWAMLDSEPFDELGTNWPRLSDIQRFDDRWHALDDRVLTHYLPHWFWEQRLGKASLAGLRGPLVASDYGSNLSMTPSALYRNRGGDTSPAWTAYGGKSVSVFQYGSRCQIPGASLGTDINAFRGTQAQLITLLQGGPAMCMEAHDLLSDGRTSVNAALLETHARVGDIYAGRLPALVNQLTGLSGKVDLVAAKVGSGSSVTLTEEDRATIIAGVLAGLNMTDLAQSLADAVVAKVSALRFGVQG